MTPDLTVSSMTDPEFPFTCQSLRVTRNKATAGFYWDVKLQMQYTTAIPQKLPSFFASARAAIAAAMMGNGAIELKRSPEVEVILNLWAFVGGDIAPFGEDWRATVRWVRLRAKEDAMEIEYLVRISDPSGELAWSFLHLLGSDVGVGVSPVQATLPVRVPTSPPEELPPEAEYRAVTADDATAKPARRKKAGSATVEVL